MKYSCDSCTTFSSMLIFIMSHVIKCFYLARGQMANYTIKFNLDYWANNSLFRKQLLLFKSLLKSIDVV